MVTAVSATMFSVCLAFILANAEGADVLSAEEQSAVLNAHNSFRSELAQGTAANTTGTMPPGSNIVQLAYDAGMGAGAQSWADSCSMTHAEKEERNGNGENLFWTGNLTESRAQVLVEASNAWWAELAKFGMDASLNLTEAAFGAGVGHWSQMAWASTAKLGCGVATCASQLYVVCRYGPNQNTLNQLVYQSGTACSACAQYANSNSDCRNGLCVLSP